MCCALRHVTALQCDPDGLGIVLWRTFWSALVQHSQVEGAANVWQDHCKRCFAQFDEHQNGFIATTSLQALCAIVGSPLSELEPTALAARCDPDGLSIVLWSSFWGVASEMRPALGVAAATGGGSETAAVGVGVGGGAAKTRQFRLFHYNGLKRTIHGEDHGPRCVKFQITVFDDGEMGGSLPNQVCGRGRVVCPYYVCWSHMRLPRARQRLVPLMWLHDSSAPLRRACDDLEGLGAALAWSGRAVVSYNVVRPASWALPRQCVCADWLMARHPNWRK